MVLLTLYASSMDSKSDCEMPPSSKSPFRRTYSVESFLSFIVACSRLSLSITARTWPRDTKSPTSTFIFWILVPPCGTMLLTAYASTLEAYVSVWGTSCMTAETTVTMAKSIARTIAGSPTEKCARPLSLP